jgi:hypothetical protein
MDYAIFERNKKQHGTEIYYRNQETGQFIETRDLMF